MNRMWSVRTVPYFVETVLPSTSGSRSRWTPSRETCCAGVVAAARDLVDLVEEHDSVLLDVLHRARLEIVLVDELSGLLLDQELERIAYLQPARAAPPPSQVLEHALELAGHLLHARRSHDLDPDRRHAQLDLDLALVELPLGAASCGTSDGSMPTLRRLRPPMATLARAGRSRMSRIRSSAASSARRRTLLHLALPVELDRDIGEIAHDGLDIAADVPDLRELGSLDLDERRRRRGGRDGGRSRSCRLRSVRSSGCSWV